MPLSSKQENYTRCFPKRVRNKTEISMACNYKSLVLVRTIFMIMVLGFISLDTSIPRNRIVIQTAQTIRILGYTE